MDSKVAKLLSHALGLPADADDEARERALRDAGVEGGRLFTQEEVNTLLAGNKKSLRTENERLAHELDEASGLLRGLLDDEDAPPEDLRGRLDRVGECVVDLRRRLAESDDSRQSAETRARETERDRLLVGAAGRAGMIDPEGEGLTLFRHRMKEVDNGQWRFLDDEGVECDVDDGLAAALSERKHLVRAQLRPGSGSGQPRRMDPLADAGKRLDACRKEPADPRDNRDLLDLADALLDVGRLRRGGL